jgi:hypothetical protein
MSKVHALYTKYKEQQQQQQQQTNACNFILYPYVIVHHLHNQHWSVGVVCDDSQRHGALLLATAKQKETMIIQSQRNNTTYNNI